MNESESLVYRFAKRASKDRETMRDKVRRWAQEEADEKLRNESGFEDDADSDVRGDAGSFDDELDGG